MAARSRLNRRPKSPIYWQKERGLAHLVKEVLAASQYHWIDEEPKLIDQIMAHQRLDELSAAMDAMC
jgi:hypothetical protein